MFSKLNGNMVNGSFSVSGEIDTGETWIDGRKIYRRTFTTTDLISDGTTLALYFDTINCNEIWIDHSNSYIRNSDAGQVFPLCVTYEAYSVGAWVNKSGIRIQSKGAGWNTNWTKVITLRYTH